MTQQEKKYISTYKPRYRIVSALDSSMVFDLTKEKKVILNKWNETNNQKWKLQHKENSKYRIQNVNFRSYLSIKNFQNADDVQQGPLNNQNDEIFKILSCPKASQQGKLAYHIINHYGKAVHVNAQQTNANKTIVEQDFYGQKTQIFYIEPTAFLPQLNKQYKIVSVMKEQFSLDLSQDYNQVFNLTMSTYQGKPNQKFNIRYAYGHYFISCTQNDFTLQVQDNKIVNCTHVIGYLNQKQRPQRWQIIPSQNQKYKGKQVFIIRFSGSKVLDVYGGDVNNGKQLIIHDYHGQGNQLWYIKSV